MRLRVLVAALYSLQQFIDSGLSLAVYDGDRRVFCSRGSGLNPLVEFLDEAVGPEKGLTIFDRYVGRAAALLMTLASPLKVHSGVISQGGAEVFHQQGIPYEADRTVQYLMDVASEGMCRWERTSLGKTPCEFLEEVKKTMLGES